MPCYWLRRVQGGIQFHSGLPVGADLRYLGPANQRRGRYVCMLAIAVLLPRAPGPCAPISQALIELQDVRYPVSVCVALRAVSVTIDESGKGEVRACVDV